MQNTRLKFLFLLTLFLSSAAFSIGQLPATDIIDLSKVKNQEIIKAFDNAKAHDKAVLIIFDATWCPYCEHLNEAIAQDEEIIKTLEKFEKINVDVDENGSDAVIFNGKPRSQGGDGIPAIIVFSSEGKELARTTGFADSKDFNSFLKNSLKTKKKKVAERSNNR